MSRPVAVLRPEPGNAATARRLETLGYRALRLPLFVVRATAWTVPDPADYDSLLLSSANAVLHGGPYLTTLRALPVHAVGETTADAARHAGFNVVAVGTAGIDAMHPPGRVLRLVGREHRAGPTADSIMVYASDPLYPDLGALTGGVALVHSPRAGRALADLVAERSTIAIAAISPTAAEATGTGWRAVATADHPTDAALIAAAGGLAD